MGADVGDGAKWNADVGHGFYNERRCKRREMSHSFECRKKKHVDHLYSFGWYLTLVVPGQVEYSLNHTWTSQSGQKEVMKSYSIRVKTNGNELSRVMYASNVDGLEDAEMGQGLCRRGDHSLRDAMECRNNCSGQTLRLICTTACLSPEPTAGAAR